MSTEPHHSITDAAADALHERIRSLETNRWTAFTSDELGALAARTVDQHPQEYDWPVHALYVEIAAEIERRQA